MLRSIVQRRGALAAARRAVQQRGFRASASVDYKREAEPPLGPSLVEKYQLDEPTRYVPLTIGTFGLATITGLYHWDAESQLLALWVLYCGTVYSRGGPIISEMLDEISDTIEKEHSEVEKLEIEAATVALQAAKAQTVIHNDIKLLFDAQRELTGELLAGAQNKWKHGMRAGFVRQLDYIVSQERKLEEDTAALLKEKATEAVQKAYSTNDSLKDKAMDAALAALAAPEGAKKDATVGALYSKYFQDFQTKYNADKGKPQELSKETQAAVKEAMEALARRENIDPSQVQVPTSVTL